MAYINTRKRSSYTSRRARQQRNETIKCIGVVLGSIVALPVVGSVAMMCGAVMANNQYTSTVLHDVPAMWVAAFNFVF